MQACRKDTLKEKSAQREAANHLARKVARRWSNHDLPVKADTDVTDADLKEHHLLLIGRPDSNAVVERVKSALPVTFGSRSFVVRGPSYAHAGSAVIAAGENPLNPRYSVVVMAGLGAESTLRLAPALARQVMPGTEVLLWAHGSPPRALVAPARELVREVAGR